MKKTRQLGIRWAPHVRERWEKLAKDTFHIEASPLARGVLEEFMACFLTDRELEELGLPTMASNRPGAFLSMVLRKYRAHDPTHQD